MNHGTSATYARGCRCDRCRAANAGRVGLWQHRTRSGADPIRVDKAPAREHIAVLRASGWTLQGIAEETGYSFHTIKELTAASSTRSRVHRDVAAAVLAVAPLEPVLVDAVMVDRLVAAYPARVWDDLGASREERLAAAAVLDARGNTVREHLATRGFGDQQTDVPSRNGIERALTLRAGRDFAVRQDVAS